MAEPNGSFEDIDTADNQTVIRVINKCDTTDTQSVADVLYISARNNYGIDNLLTALRNCVDTTALYRGEPVVSNLRHYESLCLAFDALTAAQSALQNSISSDLLAEDIRTAIHHIGCITGSITSDTILHSIFSSFCIGK